VSFTFNRQFYKIWVRISKFLRWKFLPFLLQAPLDISLQTAVSFLSFTTPFPMSCSEIH
jgi:hypothetical protein